ncbi:MAG: M15 family metallopeptidase [Spirochaetales bacterium]|nr:M15 family metallopeptidase [Spirochaetales bacterium]
MIAIVMLITGLLVSGCSGSSSELVHPGYDITIGELESMVAPLPGEIRETIIDNPVCFLDRLSNVLEVPAELFLIADKDHNLGADYVPEDLVNLGDYPLYRNRDGMMLRAVALPDTLAMAEAARQEGIKLVFSSAYRSYGYQETVYLRNVSELGREQADRESARPGASQHQLGTAVDFGSITDSFAATPAGRWLVENAWKYGYSLSYPDGYEQVTGYRHEIWHYRYISRPAAYLERVYFHSLQHYLLLFLDSNRASLEEAYRGGDRNHGSDGQGEPPESVPGAAERTS